MIDANKSISFIKKCHWHENYYYFLKIIDYIFFCSFFVQSISELENSIKDLKDRLYTRKDTFQPLVVVAGPLLKIQQVYVVVEDQKY